MYIIIQHTKNHLFLSVSKMFIWNEIEVLIWNLRNENKSQLITHIPIPGRWNFIFPSAPLLFSNDEDKNHSNSPAVIFGEFASSINNPRCVTYSTFNKRQREKLLCVLSLDNLLDNGREKRDSERESWRCIVSGGIEMVELFVYWLHKEP